MPISPTGEKLDYEYNLLDRFTKADSDVLDLFYTTYLPGVMKYVCRNGGNEDDARDVFQEALLVLYKQANSGKFHLSSGLETYIFSICRFQWLKHLRKNNRIESLPENLELTDLNPDVFQVIEKAEKFVLLQSHLTKLSTTGQQILNLHFQKYSTEEIAETLGLSKLYVKKRKFECKKELIESMQNDLRFNELK